MPEGFIKKDHFTSDIDFQRAVGDKLYADSEPVDPMMAGLCLKDKVDRLGEISDMAAGVCRASVNCNFYNDKITGVNGTCMKLAVGVEQVEGN